MTMIKARAMEILQEIPDDKIVHIIEVLKGLRPLSAQDGKSMVNDETPSSVMGICSKYASPYLVPLEKEAWSEAVKEKHAIR